MGIQQSQLFRFSLIMLVLAVIGSSAADASPAFTVLHAFCKKLACVDGTNPSESLVMDQAGNLFGTARGGAHNSGIAFELIPQTDTRYWQYKVLYHFCALQNCSDGAGPNGPLTVDTVGNVYGTTGGGGAGNNAGTVFRLSPRSGAKGWTLTTLYSFCVKTSSCRDGLNPGSGLEYSGREAGLPYDGVSPLYGTTTSGGPFFGGVAYSLRPNPKGSWSQTVLYEFCQESGQSCTDGRAPYDHLTMDSSGNLYGLAVGPNGDIAFRLNPQPGQDTFNETVLHSFCASCQIAGGLTIDQNDNLFGASRTGGSGSACTFNQFNVCGFAFKIDASGKVSVIYDFCSLPNCADGAGPANLGSGLLIDTAGNLYGTTQAGGTNRQGVVFKLSGGSEQVLYNFCSKPSCKDGADPNSGLVMSSGQIYGEASSGGFYGNGAIFRLTP